MKCRNCGHKIEKLPSTSFIKKYKDKNSWCHVRHKWRKFNPSRSCHCGCDNPIPTHLVSRGKEE